MSQMTKKDLRDLAAKGGSPDTALVYFHDIETDGLVPVTRAEENYGDATDHNYEIVFHSEP